MSNSNQPTWRDVKSKLVEKDKAELLKLVSSLYSLSSENRSFIHTKFSMGEQSQEPYRSIISESLYPDGEKPLRLSAGRKAISDYFKATNDSLGKLELMVHYLEMGNKFTVDFGDIGENFYSSLESMFERIVSLLLDQTPEIQDQYHQRLEKVVDSADGIGWGYYDYICDVFYQYEFDKNGA